MSQIAKILHAADETPSEILRAMLPGVLVLSSCAFVLAGLSALHSIGVI
ncbi:MAG TPA: hypothetical protein VEJ63_04120 [Planctomycetota bacterium]|nr:hypothetical protein [Planctomycetota bacterium]